MYETLKPTITKEEERNYGEIKILGKYSLNWFLIEHLLSKLIWTSALFYFLFFSPRKRGVNSDVAVRDFSLNTNDFRISW